MPKFILSHNSLLNLAAIDLGSNALRVIIVSVHDKQPKILKTLRIPLRLGEDVLNSKKVSPQNEKKIYEAFVEILYVLSEYNVTQVRACATAALRTAKNSKKIIQSIKKLTGIELEIISGLEEASLISDAVQFYFNKKNKNLLIMDIGGGSTEIILSRNKKIKAIKSFNIGTLKYLSLKNLDLILSNIKKDQKKIFTFLNKKSSPDYFIGTGGNLRRLGRIHSALFPKESVHQIPMNNFKELRPHLLIRGLLFSRLGFGPNQADVLLPAYLMTNQLMNHLKSKVIYVPPIGLKEGLMLSLLEGNEVKKKFIKETAKILD